MHDLPSALVDLRPPHGPAWDFLILLAVVVAGPRLVSRARVHSTVGLLLGGFAVGPNGLGLLVAGDSTIPEIGQLSLLYLVFVAGVGVDLTALRSRRKVTTAYASLSFGLPALAGTGLGLGLGWDLPPAVLLGALIGSHSLLALPTLRDERVADDPAVRTTTGATVVTDMLTLGTVAVVASLETADAPLAVTGGRLVVGLAVVVAFAFAVLPRVAGRCLRTLGADRAVRCLVAVGAFLSSATLAEAFGVEGVVGAFLAGVALARSVPEAGPLREHVEMFGRAVFVPVFLVSVGVILDPAVLARGETLLYAALAVAAWGGGKTAAAALTARIAGYSRAQAGLMLGLGMPQAAAALAATVVGYEIGLFSTAVVNAVLVLTLLSVVAGSAVAARAAHRAPCPLEPERSLGDHVLLVVDRPDPSPAAFAVAAALAAPDGGVVDTVLVLAGDPSGPPGPGVLDHLAERVARAGIDGRVSLRVDRSLPQAVAGAALAQPASAVVVCDPVLDAAASYPSWADAAGASPVPLFLVCGSGEAERAGAAGTLRGARLVARTGADACPTVLQLAAEVAARLGLGCRHGRAGAGRPAGTGHPAGAGPPWGAATGVADRSGEVTVLPVAGWDHLAGVSPPRDGSTLVVVPPWATATPAPPPAASPAPAVPAGDWPGPMAATA